MLADHKARADLLAAERARGAVGEEIATAGADPAGVRTLRLHGAILRTMPNEPRPKGRTKLATATTTLKVGDPAPEFTLRAHDGRTITLAALRGQRVVLAFMAFAFSAT